MKPLAVIVAFIVGFITASYVWALTTQRVTYQHAIELWDLKCNGVPN